MPPPSHAPPVSWPRTSPSSSASHSTWQYSGPFSDDGANGRPLRAYELAEDAAEATLLYAEVLCASIAEPPAAEPTQPPTTTGDAAAAADAAPTDSAAAAAADAAPAAAAAAPATATATAAKPDSATSN